MTFMKKSDWTAGTANGGVSLNIYKPFLEDRGWKQECLYGREIKPLRIFRPQHKNMIALLKPKNKKGSHLVCIKDGKVLDSWDCLKSKDHYYVHKIYYKMNRAQRNAWREFMRSVKRNPKWNYVRVPRKKKEAK